MQVNLSLRNRLMIVPPCHESLSAHLHISCAGMGGIMATTLIYNTPVYILQKGCQVRLVAFEDRAWAAEWLWKHRHDWAVIRRVPEVAEVE